MSILNIQANPQDTSNFYLANIQEALTHPNPSTLSFPSSPPPFSPPTYGIWVNSLWFLSLVINLTCAVLANLLQHWARKYLKVTQQRYTASPPTRARSRAFYAEGVESFFLPWVFEALPAMLHLSVFLFFAGLVVFLWNFDPTIAKLILSWVGGCGVLYGYITFIPIFRHDSPYHTPLSLLAWDIVTGIPFLICRVFDWMSPALGIGAFCCLCCPCIFFPCACFVGFCGGMVGVDEGRLKSWLGRYRKLFVRGMLKTAEESSLNLPSKLGQHAFMWTFDSLHEDKKLERFFYSIPGFYRSDAVKFSLYSLAEAQMENLLSGLIGFLDRTYSSVSLPEPDKNRRAMICTRALDPTKFPDEYKDILFRILSEDQYGPVYSAEIARFVRNWYNGRDVGLMKATVSAVLARAQRRDDHWFTIASEELRLSEPVLRGYDTNGDSLSLAVFIHVTRQHFVYFPGTGAASSWPRHKFWKVLVAASKFDVGNTSPELQHEFCGLWNRIVRKAHNNNVWDYQLAELILKPIRHVYLALHRGTDCAPTRFSPSTRDHARVLLKPTSYPLCSVPGHIHVDSTSATYPRTVMHGSAAASASSLASPDAPSSFVPALGQVVESHMTMPLSDIAHVNIDPPDILVTTPDSATSGITKPVPRLTPETSTIATPLSSPSLPAAASRQYNADPMTPPEPSKFLSSASSNPVLDNILHTGPSLSSLLPMTRSDLSHRLIIVATVSPGASLGTTSAPDLGATAEDDGSHMPGLSEEMDTLDPPSANRTIHANTMAPPDLPLQSSSPLPITHSVVATAGPPPREPNAKHTGDHPPDLSHFQYDMV